MPRNVLLLVFLTVGALMAPMRSVAETSSTFRIFGYLPDYRIQKVAPQVGKLLTDVIFYSVEPSADGKLNKDCLSSENLAVLEAIRSHGTRIHLTLGGGRRSAGFSALVANENASATFVNEVVTLVDLHKLDGIDVNWEFPRTTADQDGFAKLLLMLKKELAKRRCSLSLAIAPWQKLSPEAIEAADFFHLMAYDNSGEHSTLEFAIQQTARVQLHQVPAAKLSLGIPFYGRNVEDRKARTYAQIVRRYQPKSDATLVDGVYFNGPDTVRQKVEFARKENLAGVMIWEIGQDVPNTFTLLHAAHRAAHGDAN